MSGVMEPSSSGRRMHTYRWAGAGSPNLCSMLDSRGIGLRHPFGRLSKGLIGKQYVPNEMVSSIKFENQVFCGQFSSDGEVYMSACQEKSSLKDVCSMSNREIDTARLKKFVDQSIRLYKTSALKRQTPFKTVEAREIGYSIIDVDFSPDQRMLIYSSWSNYVHMCNVYGDMERHEPLDFQPQRSRVCFFSVKFSPDSREIIGGCSDNSIYVYDIEAQKPVIVVPAHRDDVNSVCFADDSPFIIYSASDDALCKVWDRRVLGKGEMKAVGALVGHSDGLTHVSSKGDGRYLVTNSKDQTAKLWDMRAMTDDNEVLARLDRHRGHRGWDYRWEDSPRQLFPPAVKNDTSVWTFQGHCVLQTLIRCYFSPAATTAQRYVYVGCASRRSSLHMYDTVTGERAHVLYGHETTVRDSSWHPYLPLLVTASWDCSIGIWEHRRPNSDDDDSRDVARTKRRSCPSGRSRRF